MDKATDRGVSGGAGAKSPAGDKSSRRRGSQLDKLTIDATVVVRAKAPAGSRHKGYEEIVVQDLNLSPQVTLYCRERWETPEGERIIAALDPGIVGGYGRICIALIAVAPRAWAIEHVGMARPAGGPTPEYQRLREGELARIGAARSQVSPGDGWAQRFIWPARGRISGVFGAQRIYRGGVPAAYHSGVDIAAGAGAVVVAPADGVVTLAPPPMFSLEGNLVIVNHGMGLSSAFLHLARATVHAGDIVRQGQPIGIVGATGRATGPHLHWSVVWNGAGSTRKRSSGPDPSRRVGPGSRAGRRRSSCNCRARRGGCAPGCRAAARSRAGCGRSVSRSRRPRA